MVVAVVNDTAAASRGKSIVDNMLTPMPSKCFDVRRRRMSEINSVVDAHDDGPPLGLAELG